MTAESIARALEARRTGDYWMARCPAHKDDSPSLAIRETDGRVLVHCHAGCSQRDVVSSLKAIGVWESQSTSHNTSRIIAEYDYVDECGELLYQVVRKEPKAFLQRHPNGQGDWIWKKGPRQVLYRLPEVLESSIVFITEGEKDTETLRSHGFASTTNAGGAKAPWLDAYTDTLAGREVILIPDNDAPGRQRGITIARALVGRVAKLTLLELQTAKDITEWFEQGHSELELIAQVERQVVTQ